jgi:hypothetical protein
MVVPTATANRRTIMLVLYCWCMELKGQDAVVWIGVVGVVPRSGCELLSADEGAYTNFLTLARSDSEYRPKVIGALFDYQLELVEFEDVRPFSVSNYPSEEQSRMETNSPPDSSERTTCLFARMGRD